MRGNVDVARRGMHVGNDRKGERAEGEEGGKVSLR